ncbi:MAG: FAD binding domain-containing protein [Clostridiales bacterium]|nr:FAD binding domain-containing protein [Clostridiales bacterium]MDD7433138.1 FAD binding domain-containing protein [Clostridiales bacterium]MDY3062015.1 FAD binding domain-containing protein [Eubacteriales bacterium]
MRCFQKIAQVQTLHEAAELTKKDDLIFYAGGTDLMPHFKDQIRHCTTLAILGNIPEMQKIMWKSDGSLQLGALVTLDTIDKDEKMNQYFPELSYSAARVASPQIRNLATIGGNLFQDRRCIYFNQSRQWRSSIEACYKLNGHLCHQALKSPVCRASYYSDTATVFMVLDARANVYENGISKVYSIEDLLKRHSELNKTSNTENMLITTLDIPKRRGFGYFIKSGVRSSVDFPIFNAAVCVKKNTQGQWEATLAVGAVGPVPILLPSTSTLLTQEIRAGRKLASEEVFNKALEEIYRQATFILEDNISIKTKRDACRFISILLDKACATASTT